MQFLDTVHTVRRQMNPALVLTGLLITMADERTRLAQDVENELRAHFPELVLKTVVPRSVRIAEAPSFALPITEHAPGVARGRRLPVARRRGARPWLTVSVQRR